MSTRLTIATLAALAIASVASISANRPLVSINPIASFIRELLHRRKEWRLGNGTRACIDSAAMHPRGFEILLLLGGSGRQLHYFDDVFVRAGNHLHADHLAHATGRSGT